jgi:hypothetical protein
MQKERYWRTALSTYLKISFSYFVAFSAAPLASVLVDTLWTAKVGEDTNLDKCAKRRP